MRIDVTREILSPRPSEFLRSSTIHFRMFLYLLTCFLRVSVSLLRRSQAISTTHVPIFPYLISEGRQACNRHSNKTVTFRNHVTKYKNMRKWIVEFFRKSESRGDEIVRVNSTNSLYQFTLIFYGAVVYIVMSTFLNYRPCTVRL